VNAVVIGGGAWGSAFARLVEGLTTAPVLRELSERVGVEMPITNAVCDILGCRSLDELTAGLMGRKPTAE
jgi:glycerol-3-phosphate dehydrogenase